MDERLMDGWMVGWMGDRWMGDKWEMGCAGEERETQDGGWIGNG